LQQHRGKLCAPDIGSDVPGHAQTLSQTRPLDPDVRLGQLELLAQGDFLAPLGGKEPTQQLTESADDLECFAVSLRDDQRTHRVQRVEQKMWLQLQRQRSQLRRCEVRPQSLGSQLFLAANDHRAQVVTRAKDERVDDEREVGGGDELLESVVPDDAERRRATQHDPRDTRCHDIDREDERDRDRAVRDHPRPPASAVDRALARRPDDSGRRDAPQQQEYDLLEHRLAHCRTCARATGDECRKREDVDDRGNPERGDDLAGSRTVRRRRWCRRFVRAKGGEWLGSRSGRGEHSERR